MKQLTKEELFRLSIILLPNLMISLNTYMLQVALPEIEQSLSMSFNDAQFVLTGYSLGLASFLIISSFLGDRLGQKKILLIGIFFFMLLALIGGSTHSAKVLILVRIFQGITGALIQPQVMVLMREGFSKEKQGPVFAIYGMVIGLGFTFGLLLGGIIMEWNLAGNSWRNIFFINIPVCLLVLLLSRFIPERKGISQENLDKVGSLLLIGGSFLLAYHIVYFAGLSSFFFILVAALILFLFFLVEKKQTHPLVQLAVFKEDSFSKGLLSVFSIYLTMFALFFLVTYYAQEGLGKSVFETGFIFLPLGIGFTIASISSSYFLKKRGNHLLLIGILMMIFSLFLLAISVSKQSDLFAFFNISLLFLYGIGLGFTTTPLIGIILIKVTSRFSALASSMINMTMYFSNIIGVALMGNLFKGIVQSKDSYVLSFICSLLAIVVVLVMTFFLFKSLLIKKEKTCA